MCYHYFYLNYIHTHVSIVRFSWGYSLFLSRSEFNSVTNKVFYITFHSALDPVLFRALFPNFKRSLLRNFPLSVSASRAENLFVPGSVIPLFSFPRLFFMRHVYQKDVIARPEPAGAWCTSWRILFGIPAGGYNRDNNRRCLNPIRWIRSITIASANITSSFDRASFRMRSAWYLAPR